jgi:hypothetical protein
MKHGTIMPLIANHLEMYKKQFPSMPSDCPMQPGNYSGNYTYNLDPSATSAINETKIIGNKATAGWINFNGFKIMNLPLVNGIYKCSIHAWTKSDPDGAHMNWQYEIHSKMGTDKF